MNLPKKTSRYCRHCKKHTSHKISIMSTGHQRGSLKRGSLVRAKKRGKSRGMGNHGRWGSKPPINRWKRRAKSTQRKIRLYKCEICGKSSQNKTGIRTSKLTVGEKTVAKER